MEVHIFSVSCLLVMGSFIRKLPVIRSARSKIPGYTVVGKTSIRNRFRLRSSAEDEGTLDPFSLWTSLLSQGWPALQCLSFCCSFLFGEGKYLAGPAPAKQRTKASGSTLAISLPPSAFGCLRGK
ncbi:unnamed protein product [Durusdinium trenchii]|uniref:Secreted protein n=1 Tax=Durusdinium trenchii TaxID=1381693 RepID=A0ABP0QCF6_9DINO